MICPLGKRLYCPCLSFSEAVTKESLGLSREADEGEEEVDQIMFLDHPGPSKILFLDHPGPSKL